MEDIQTAVGSLMRDIVGFCITPVIILLILAIIFVIACLGWLIVEYFTEHRHFKVFVPRLIDELHATEGQDVSELRNVIRKSGLLTRQKRYLLELTAHPEISAAMRESMAVDLEYRERAHFDGIVKITDLLSRIAPMLGLLGTLIPLGPGIMALSGGDTETLSASLLTAFDTTSLGLIIACFALVISAVRKRWYKSYMVVFDACMEVVLDLERIACGEEGLPHDPSAGAPSRILGDRNTAHAPSDKTAGRGESEAAI